MFRVGIVAIQHESNTFIRKRTTLQEFHEDAFLTGRAIQEQYQSSAHEVGGFFTGLSEAGIEAVPLLFARAIPGGMIDRDTALKLIQIMEEQVRGAGPLDGCLVAPHGAGVSELDRDFDGYWLSLLREIVGPRVPVICTIDPHANLSARMVQACDATIAYRSNPHIDQRARGVEAARLMARTLRGEVRPTQAACFVPMVINIERQHTPSEPCASLYRVADEMLQQPGVLSNSIVLGFPYADVEEMGTSFLAVTDHDPALAQQLSDQLGAEILRRKEDFEAQLIGVDDALDQASQSQGPVCLLEMGDNVGGGSPADGTWLLHALHERGDLRGFVCLNDPEAAQTAIAAGVGSTLRALSLGGKVDPLHGPPFVSDVRVVSVHTGTFSEDQIRHGGSVEFHMGPTVVVQTPGQLTIMLTSLRTPPFSLKQLTSCGVKPEEFQVLVAKGVQAPLAAYREVCTQAIRVNTAGVTSADMTQFNYQFRRRPLFPFEREF
ncbi:M81 family metallopeptidase [Planctomicrobium sp. SH661]|uniref:M81 family metallopeptidase n=1 Tax=Planctomicrobium sp. SH661 TaxID=3448124 RepID=UPI003F5BCD4C